MQTQEKHIIKLKEEIVREVQNHIKMLKDMQQRIVTILLSIPPEDLDQYFDLRRLCRLSEVDVSLIKTDRLDDVQLEILAEHSSCPVLSARDSERKAMRG